LCVSPLGEVIYSPKELAEKVVFAYTARGGFLFS